MKTVSVMEAVGHVLAHDITEIKPGVCKGRAFRKGHMVRPEDVERLRDLGKENLFVLELQPGHLHEDDAVYLLADALRGPGVEPAGEPREGKINLKASWAGGSPRQPRGPLPVQPPGRRHVRDDRGGPVCPGGEDRRGNAGGAAYDSKSRVEEAAAIARESGAFSVSIRCARLKSASSSQGTKSSGRIEDAFAPIVRGKAEALSCEIVSSATAPDDADAISGEIRKAIDAGADLLVTSGGMSVDPDDVTREGIRRAGAREIVHGAAILPGSVFAIAYFPGPNGTEIPAPRDPRLRDLPQGDRLRRDPSPRPGRRADRPRASRCALGHGGLCEDCHPCIFPACPYGKG